MIITSIWQFISIFGDIQFWIGAALASLIIYILAPKEAKKHIIWFIFGVLPSVIISWLSVEGLKFLFKVQRPCIGLDFCPTNYSFPSGHAAVIFAAMSVAIIYSKSRKMDLSFLLLAFLVSLSRVFLGVHTIQDIIGGGVIGFIIGSVVYRNYKQILHKFKLRL